MVKKEKNKILFNKSNIVFKDVIRTLFITVAIILFLLFLLILVYFADSLLNVTNGKKNTPIFGAYVVVTESMVPSIKVNDAILIVRTDSVKVGDIITFFSRDKYYYGKTITHRVVGKRSDGKEYHYKTKGDNNNLADTSWVNSNDIYGKVILIIPKFGYIQNFVTSPFGFVVTILVPILFVVIYEFYRIASLLRKKNSELEII